MGKELRVGFIGNPNCGKTTLFNAYTGANLKVANWPGVTVEKVEGSFRYKDYQMKLIDLPGTYSLTSYTMEEKVARQCIFSDDVDVVVDGRYIQEERDVTLEWKGSANQRVIDVPMTRKLGQIVLHA